MSLCEHCKSRYSWDCDDGYAYPEHGCSGFALDWYTLNEKQKKAIIRNLDEKERCWYEGKYGDSGDVSSDFDYDVIATNEVEKPHEVDKSWIIELEE